MKIISIVVMLIAFCISALVNAFLWLLSLPRDFIRTQKLGWLVFVTYLPQHFREIIKVYDASGLRHNHQYLNKPETRNMVASLPIERQIEYADLITYDLFSKKNNLDINSDIIVNDLRNIDMTTVNATAIGNIAFWALYCGDEDIINAAQIILADIKQHFVRN